MTLSRALCDEEPTPAAWGLPRRQEDGVIGHQGKQRWRCVARACSREGLIEGKRKGRELADANERKHGGTGLCGRLLARCLLPEEAVIGQRRQLDALAGMQGVIALCRTRNG